MSTNSGRTLALNTEPLSAFGAGGWTVPGALQAVAGGAAELDGTCSCTSCSCTCIVHCTATECGDKTCTCVDCI